MVLFMFLSHKGIFTWLNCRIPGHFGPPHFHVSAGFEIEAKHNRRYSYSMTCKWVAGYSEVTPRILCIPPKFLLPFSVFFPLFSAFFARRKQLKWMVQGQLFAVHFQHLKFEKKKRKKSKQSDRKRFSTYTKKSLVHCHATQDVFITPYSILKLRDNRR